MPYIQVGEKVIRDEITQQLDVTVETPHFSYTAVGGKDGIVDVYVIWGDDQSGDMMSFESWAEARSHFKSLTSPEMTKAK